MMVCWASAYCCCSWLDLESWQEEETMYEFQIALELMRDARRYGVTKHVLQTARKYWEQNATASLSDCIWEGYCEWVK